MRRALVFLLVVAMLTNVLEIRGPVSASPITAMAAPVVAGAYSAAMYAPPPRFPYSYHPAMPLPDLRSYRNAYHINRYGNRMQSSLRGTGFDPHHIPLDPLAMRPSFGFRINRFSFANRGVHVAGSSRMRTFGGPEPSPDVYCPTCTPVPTPKPTATPTPKPTATPTPKPTATPTPMPTATPSTTPSPTPSPTPGTTATPTPAPTSVSNAGDTGINPWWTYEEDNVAGVGRAMVNVGNGNFLLQADDIDVHERGIDLAYRRTYNSMSGHDVNGSDGSGPSVFGNKWTSTFDAHLAYNSTTNVLTVYDIDGASYPYTANAGAWVPPAGVHTTLTSDGSCGYYWTKKTGTSYHFYAPYATSCGYPAGTYGRITQLYARNNNSVINFTYSWGGAGSSLEQLTQLVVAHSDGQTLTLNFSAFGSYTELSSIVRPDGAEVTYSYDMSGNLLEVDRPGNSTISVLPETYAYSANASGPTMTIYSPRATLASRQSTQDGEYYTVQVDTSNHAIGAYKTGLFNPTPNDGTNTALQTGAAWRVIDDRTFSGFGSGTTSSSDTDGHANSYSVDTLARVTERSEWNGSVWLVSNDTWDTNNDLVETTDERGNATDYAYDLNGNTIAQALPSVTTNLGTFRPTSLYSYDSFNNVVAYCDPNYTNSLGRNWTSTPASSDSLCPASTGASQFTFSYPAYENFGELTASTTPLGYTRQISYAPASQGGTDFGLPTSVVGSAITQADATARTPTETFSYDGSGNVLCYGNGSGTYALKYDSLNRLTVVGDPDDGSLGQCGKPATSYRTASYTSYNPDGTISLESTPSQYAASAGTANTFDADGDKVTEKIYFAAGTPVTHTKWYDGDDRLIEVDNGSTTSAGWLTRYLYDLSLGQGVSLLATGTFYAHGNLYGTETGGPPWLEQKGIGYDALDREVSTYRWPMNCAASCTSVAKATKTYDSSAATLGLLSSTTNEVGGTATYAYDASGREISQSYSGDGGATPNESMTYDADGHTITITSSVFGTTSDTYDADGRLTKRVEPSGGGLSSSATITYDYYGDAMRKDIGVSSSALTKLPLFQYSYRTDGERQTLSAFSPSGSTKYQWVQTAAGRYTSQVVNGTTTVTQTYDTYGQALARTVPSTSQYYAASSAKYDLQGNLLSVFLGGTGGVTQTSTYDQINEIAGTTPSVSTSVACGVSQVCPYVTRGYQRGGQQSIKTQTTQGGHSTTVSKTNSNDLRSGAILGYSTTPSYAPATPNPGCGGPVIDSRKYTYDAAGRETVGSWSWANTLAAGKTCTYQTSTGSMSQTFDSEERMVSHTETNWELNVVASKSTTPFTWTFGYGPTGHLALVTTSAPGATSGATTLHWDGNSLLFTSNSTGVSVYVDGSLGQDAVANDFDIAGYTKPTEGYALNFLSFPIAATRDPYQFYPNAYPESFTYTAPGAITDTINTFQGARQVDNVTGQWLSPDPYAGEMEDPGTQRAYMWNSNNPISYNDPSGYCDKVKDPKCGIDASAHCHGCNKHVPDPSAFFAGLGSVYIRSDNYIGKTGRAPRFRAGEHYRATKLETLTIPGSESLNAEDDAAYETWMIEQAKLENLPNTNHGTNRSKKEKFERRMARGAEINQKLRGSDEPPTYEEIQAEMKAEGMEMPEPVELPEIP